MTRARDIANLVDSNGDIVVGALDNVPASNDASALTTGTLPAARLPTSGISASALTTGQIPNLSAIPNGGVVKVDMIVGRTENTQAVNNSTTFATDFNVTYNCVSGGNKLIVLVNYSHFGDVDNDGHASISAQIRMQYSTDGGTTYVNAFSSGNSLLDRGGQSRHRTCDFMREIDLPATVTNNEVRVRLQGRRVSGTRSYNMGGQVGSHLTFIEVAA